MSVPSVEYQVDKSADPTKVTLTFKGTCNCQLGHAIDPSVTMVAKKFKIMRDKKREEENKEEVQRLEKASLKKRQREEFIEKGRLFAMYSMLERRVQAASMCTDHLLNQKRDKLRKLLLAEEENYATEYVSACQAAYAAREEELKQKHREVQAKKEHERQEFAKEKMLQLKIQACETARPLMSKQALMMVKQDQLWQIKEKYALKEAKREEERMYHDLMMRNLLELKEREEEDAKMQWMKQQEMKEMFVEQMKWKRMKDERERQMKEFERKEMEVAVQKYKEEAELELEARRRKTAQRIAEYQEYLAKERELKEKRQKEEEEIDKAFQKLMQLEEEREKEVNNKTKEKLKREMDAYLESYREIQRLKELEERKFDQMVEELSVMIRAKQDCNRSRMRAAKQELFCTVMKERAEQLREKRERERLEEEARNREIELLNLQIEQQRRIREEYERRCAEKREEYGQQLKRQMKEVEEAREKKKRDELEYDLQLKLDHEAKVREVEQIIENFQGLRLHPMKEIILNNPPKYVGPCPPHKPSGI